MVEWELLRQQIEDAMWRRRENLTKFAETVGVSHGTLSNIRNKRKRPEPETLKKLAPYVNADLDTLLQWADYKPASERPSAMPYRGEAFTDLTEAEWADLEKFADFIRSKRERGNDVDRAAEGD